MQQEATLYIPKTKRWFGCMLLITSYEIQLFAIIQIKTLQMVSFSVGCPFDPRNGGESWFVQRHNTSDCRVFLS